MRSTTTILALVLATLLGAVSCSRDPEVAKKRYLENGNKYFARAKYREARIFYKDALQKDKKYGEAYYKLGLTDIKLAETNQSFLSEAVQSFRRAVELLKEDTPEHWDAAVKLSEIYLAVGGNQKQFNSEVEEFVAGLLKRDPNSFDGHRLNGDLTFNAAIQGAREAKDAEGRQKAVQQFAVALEEYRKADTAKPNQPGVVLQMARAYGFRGTPADLQEAENLYRKTLDLNKAHPRAWYEFYRLLLIEKKIAEAEQCLKNAFAANPKTVDYLLTLAAHYSLSNRKDDMVATLQEVKAHVKDFPDAYQSVGDFYLRLGDGESALREYRDGITKSPANKLVYQKRVIEVLMRQGKRSEAADINNQILKDLPNDEDAKGLAATFLLDKGEVAKALSELQAVVSRVPNNPVARYNLGRAHAARGEFEQARQAFQKAVDLRPDYTLAWLGLAQLQLRNGAYEAAQKTASSILARDPGSLSGRLVETAALLGQRKFTESRARLDNLVKTNPGVPDVYYQMGLLNLSESKFKDAEDSFRKSYQLNPANQSGLIGVVETQMVQNKPDMALKVLSDEVAKSPGRMDLVFARANLAIRAGRYDQALGDYQQVLNSLDKSSPRRADVYFRIGEVLRKKGDYAEAYANLKKSREIQPESVLTLISIGQVLDNNLGQWADGKIAYEAALRLDPNNAVALNNLAFILAEHGGDLDEALTKATRARQLLPNFAEVSDTLGWIYLKKNLSDTAIDIFKDLVQKTPNSSTFRYHLGMAYSQKGDKSRAIKELQEALKFNPSKTEKDKIQELLTRLQAA
jgi:tetratricopeptide (TPR) repeat protein